MSTVLLVEDEQALLEVFADIVAALGHDVVVAHDGQEGLELAQKRPPDVIVSDYMMPKRTGIELLDGIRADPKLAGVPFILVSAASPQGAERAWRFLSKPITLEQLERAITEALASAAGDVPQGDGPPAPAGGEGPVLRERLGAIAHRIRTPLCSARLNVELLERELAVKPDEVAQRRVALVLQELAAVSAALDAALNGENDPEGDAASQCTADQRR